MHLLESNSDTSTSYIRGLRRSGFSSPAKCVQYKDNEFARFLNNILAYEIGMKHLYYRLRNSHNQQIFSQCFGNHKEICDRLKLLIIKHHSIPNDDHSAFATDLSILLNQVGEQFGRTIARKTNFRICFTMEKNVRNKLKEALEKAPLSSHSDVYALLFLSKSNIIALEAARSTL